MRKFLQYITNDEATSRHEEIFDEMFWILETVALIFGIWILHAVRRQLFLRIDDNYFSRSTTITF